MTNKIIAQVKKNFRDYRIIERFVAGIELTGNEIKSLRNHQASINDAYVLPQQGELFVINMNVSVYKFSHVGDRVRINTRRKRKLLLKKREINKLIGLLKAKSYVLVILQLFISNKGWAKVEIALAQHLRKYQIKEVLKEKEIKRKLQKGDFW